MASALLLAYPTINNTEFLTQSPATPATEKAVTWEAAGTPTTSAVTETTACWSDDGGTTTYNSLNALVDAQTADVTLNLPAGDFIITTEISITGNYSIALVGAISGGAPNTFLQRDSGDLLLIDSTNWGATDVWVKNICIGAFDTDIAAHNFATTAVSVLQAGQTAVTYRQGGLLCMDNFEIRYVKGNGISSDAAYEWFESGGTQVGNRETGRIMIYNGELYGNTANSAYHTVYSHGVPFYAYRCIFRDTVGGAHCFKYDGELAILNQCYVDNYYDTNYIRANGTIATPIDHTQSGDLHLFDSAVVGSVGDNAASPYANRHLITIGGRQNSGGIGFSKRLPAWWKQSVASSGTTNGTPNARCLDWSNGGLSTPDLYMAKVSSYSAGTPSITLKQDVQAGHQSSGAIPNTVTASFWTVAWNGETRTATKGDGTLVFTLASAFSGTPSANEFISVYPQAAGADVLLLNQDFWDSSSGSNYMDSIKSGSTLDKTAYANFPLHKFENTMLVAKINDSITNAKCFIWDSAMPSFYTGTNSSTTWISSLPPTPVAGTDGTNSWDRAGDGAILFDLSGTMALGNEPTVDNYVAPMMTGLLGSSWVTENGSTTNDGDVQSFSDQAGSSEPYNPLVQYVEGGTDTNVADPDTTGGNWWPTIVATTTSAGASADATSITVASITGIADGDLIKIQYPVSRGNDILYVGAVNGTPSGSTVNITPALSLAVSSGARVHTQSAVGTKPGWAIDIPTIWNSRRVA